MKKTQTPQKLGFLNMIMVENQKNPLPRLIPDHEGAIKESYGASSHATTGREVIEKGIENDKGEEEEETIDGSDPCAYHSDTSNPY